MKTTFAFNRIRAALGLLLVSLLLVCGLLLSGCSSSTSSSSASNSGSPTHSSVAQDVQKATVVGIVDGDTLTAKINGHKEKIRLIGCDCPESVAQDESRNCEEGRIASKYTKSLVEKGQTIYLTKDVSDTDQYGRLLRYVWLEEPSANPTEDEIEDKMLNAILIADGYAQAKTYKPDVTLDEYFKKLGKEALKNNAGVSYKWAK